MRVRTYRLLLFALFPGSIASALCARSLDQEAEIVHRWTFESAEDARGWEVGNGIENLRVAGGRLVGQIRDPDAYLFAPAVRVPLDGLVVKVRWSCPRRGTGQCYFATDRSPHMGEDKVVSRTVPGGAMVETVFPLAVDDRDGPPLLTRFRLDPFNGARLFFLFGTLAE